VTRRLLGLAVAGIAASYLATRQPAFAESERAASAWMRKPRGRRFDTVVSTATDLGSMYAVAGASAVLAVTGRRRAAVDVIAAGSLAWAIAQATKLAVARPRPYDDEAESVERLVSTPAGSSWPSGHPAVAAACADVLGARLSPAGRRTSAMTAGLVALSRIYVGVHYPTDVVAGLGVGVLSGEAWKRISRGLRNR
jgi:glycosyltransferase 2 family protein